MRSAVLLDIVLSEREPISLASRAKYFKPFAKFFS